MVSRGWQELYANATFHREPQMDRIELLERVRTLIREALVKFGAAPDQPPTEAMLIRDGFFCGRRFAADGLQAVWFVEENQIKFFERNGSIIQVLDLNAGHLDNIARKAA